MIVESVFKARLLSESLVMSLCSILSSTSRLLSVDEMLRQAHHVDKHIKHDALKYSLLLGGPKLTVVKKIGSFLKRSKWEKGF